MSQTVKILGAICLTAGLGAASAALGPGTPRKGGLADSSAFQSAARQQQHLDHEEGASHCEMARINEAVALIYQFDDVPAALAMARRCEVFSVTMGRPDYRILASRIKALAAIKQRDMDALQVAGEAMVKESVSPEHVADGHLFIAFACTFSGRAACARTHLDRAKAMFVRHDVAGALDQLMSVEQALLKLEAGPGH